MKLKNLSLMVLGLSLIAGACSKKPAAVVEDVYKSANDRKFSNILPFILPDSVAPFTDQEKKTFEEYLSDYFGDGPVYSSYTIECEEPAEDATEMKFVVNTSMSDGLNYKETGTLVKGNDGKWRLALVNAPNDTTTLFSVTDPQKRTKELMRNLRYAYVMTMATRGIPEYQVQAAYYWIDGIMTPKSKNQYITLIKNAADKGNGEALYKLGVAYYFGDMGVEQNNQKYFEYSKMAAEAGNPQGLYNLGYAYDEGIGTMKDEAEAVKWYQKAADAGSVNAYNSLGYMYEEGRGVEKDAEKAFELYLKGAENGNGYAMNNVSLCYQNGNGTSQDMAKAVEWATKGAEAGNVPAMNHIADIYYNGTNGIERNYDKAVYWYKQAAEEKSNYAQYMMGECYEYGRGVEKNLATAKQWYRISANNNDYKPAEQALSRLFWD
ncbi:MAG: SEL1-like repeat protein [Muribaculaceae bacterium]|nr:SEL1-like repeat protein [Muribaculaceae bacterium]